MSERELYTGCNALIAYLRAYNNKSYHSFLVHNRDIIISSLSMNFNWNDIDRTWIRNFLREAENFLEQKNFADLKEKCIERSSPEPCCPFCDEHNHIYDHEHEPDNHHESSGSGPRPYLDDHHGNNYNHEQVDYEQDYNNDHNHEQRNEELIGSAEQVEMNQINTVRPIYNHII
ncbi:hypothetical protein Glove_562g19 [Diversispora epigaea]|uniref:Uncharacterized protein n=1 Tax=Diversispora epigaea TaxID=1348612 RepID=A0A397GAF8_9GLOM|nr:hypothetical protein Glove_562g19 [Diversispora epigaea]